MSRFSFSAALVAALMSTTAQLPVHADDLPLDSFPVGNTHQPAHKKKPAAHVPGVGELVPLQMPGEAAGGRKHHGKLARHKGHGADEFAVADALPPPSTAATPAAKAAAAVPMPAPYMMPQVAPVSPPAVTAAVHPIRPQPAQAGMAPPAVTQAAAVAPATTALAVRSTAGGGTAADALNNMQLMGAAAPVGTTPAAAANPPPPPPTHPIPNAARNTVMPVRNTITLEAGLGRVIELAGSTSSVFAADPKVAEVRPASSTSLFVFGVAPGRTTVAALDSDGRPVAQYDVVVVPSAYAAGAGRGGIGRALPGQDVHIETQGNGVEVTGHVATPADAERAFYAARTYVPTTGFVSNRLAINANTQVNLKVRIAEMARSVTRDLGVNWSAMGTLGKYTTFSAATANVLSNLTSSPASLSVTKTNSFEGVLQALAQDQMIHTLAEPNLTAMSGETASFLVGGEFPIPVAQQNNTTTIEFKQYGISLAFVPTVISDGHISLKVRPEVSQLTTQGAITLSSSNASIQIPALTVRRAETTVELGSGQTFAIAGLLQDASTQTDTAVPFLGEVPILGALFRSDAFQRNETELVIMVTPYIVKPSSNPEALALSTDGNPIPNDHDRLLLLRNVGRKPAPVPAAATGAAAGGFVVQ